MLKSSWLENKDNLLDVNRLDVGAATQTENKRRFLLDCQLIIKTIIQKLIEKTPIKYRLVRLASCLAPKEIFENSERSSNRFKLLVDGLSTHKKTSSKVADSAKFQYNEVQKTVFEKHDEFIKFDYCNDRLDSFLGNYFSEKKDLWHVAKLFFVLSHGQSFVERGFSINKELVDTNMKEKSLIAQRLIYDKIVGDGINVSSFQITVELRKSCMLANQRYKQSLEVQRKEKINSEKSLKRKVKTEELENIKRRKTDFQKTIKGLRKSFESETLKADKEQIVNGFNKVAAILKSVLEKEKTLKEIESAHENVENKLKKM